MPGRRKSAAAAAWQSSERWEEVRRHACSSSSAAAPCIVLANGRRCVKGAEHPLSSTHLQMTSRGPAGERRRQRRAAGRTPAPASCGGWRRRCEGWLLLALGRRLNGIITAVTSATQHPSACGAWFAPLTLAVCYLLPAACASDCGVQQPADRRGRQGVRQGAAHGGSPGACGVVAGCCRTAPAHGSCQCLHSLDFTTAHPSSLPPSPLRRARPWSTLRAPWCATCSLRTPRSRGSPSSARVRGHAQPGLCWEEAEARARRAGLLAQLQFTAGCALHGVEGSSSAPQCTIFCCSRLLQSWQPSSRSACPTSNPRRSCRRERLPFSLALSRAPSLALSWPAPACHTAGCMAQLPAAEPFLCSCCCQPLPCCSCVIAHAQHYLIDAMGLEMCQVNKLAARRQELAGAGAGRPPALPGTRALP